MPTEPSSPGWTRTTDRLLVRELPSPLGHRTICALQWTHSDLHRDFRHATPVSSCWTMSPILCRRFAFCDPSSRHAPKDSNPDQLGWNQSCCHYTRDAYLSAEGENSNPNRLAPPPVFKTGSSFGRMPSTCQQAPGVGIEPTASWFRARRHYQQQLPRIVVVSGHAQAPTSSGRRI